MPKALLAQLARRTLVLLGIFIAPSHSTVWPGHELYPLGLLDGTDGFRVTSESSAGMLGFSVAGAGDVNNDGFKDVIIGESPEFSSTAGAAYVVFGSEAFYFSNLDVSELDGNNGFRIQGSDVGDYAGTSVAGAGDINNDGAADIVIGAYRADPEGSMSGEVYIIFGSLNWTADIIDLGNLGASGLRLSGGTRREYAGYSVAGAGDVNDDGYSDVIISAHGADAAYVFYGASAFASAVYPLSELSGDEGFIISVGSNGDILFVCGAGDMNGDGYGDIAVGHSVADPATGNSAGATYVIFGGSVIESPLNVLADLDGSNGFVLEGAATGDRSGASVADAGDINQDGFGDIVVGAPGVGDDAGAAYVIFGRETFSSASFQLGSIGSDGSFILTAPSSHGFLGSSVAGTGDFNQDGFPDLVIGAYKAGTAGVAVVVFPSLIGTPPPTPSPTPAPTGPTPALVQRGGPTPAPTINFLVEGVVGGGTVYEGPGVFVRAHELGGEVKSMGQQWTRIDWLARQTVGLALKGHKKAVGMMVNGDDSGY